MTATQARTGSPARADRTFFTGMSLAMAALILAGFAPSYYLMAWVEPPPGTPQRTPLLLVHGALLTAWLALSLTQPVLIALRRPDLHRRLGWAGAALAAVCVLVANLAAIRAMKVGFIGLGDPRAFFAIPFFDIWIFALFVALAVVRRRDVQAHKRLILLAGTQLVEAAAARLIVLSGGAGLMPAASLYAVTAIVAAGIAYDVWRQGRPHRVWLWGGAIVLVSVPLRLAIMQTPPWLAFAGFLKDLM